MVKIKFTKSAVKDFSGIYRELKDQSIEITRILHERMDLKRNLKK